MAIDEGDEALVESEVLRLSRAWRPLAPLALTVGAFVMLFHGLRRVWTNWRLLLVEVVPAMWAWLAMLDLKLHVLSGRELRAWHETFAILLVAASVLVTVAAFSLNAVFAFAIADPETSSLRSAFTAARRHALVLSFIGGVLGAALGVSAFVVPRWGRGWFVLALGISVALFMLASVVVPARLVGWSDARRTQPRRDRLAAGAIAAVLGGVVCAPTYAMGRLGIALLDSNSLSVLFIVGVILLVVGFGLQSGATGAVKAIKMSAKAVPGRARSPESTVHGAADGGGTAPSTGEPDTAAGRPGPADEGRRATPAPPHLSSPDNRQGQATSSAERVRSAVHRWATRKEPDHAPPPLLAAAAAQPA